MANRARTTTPDILGAVISGGEANQKTQKTKKQPSKQVNVEEPLEARQAPSTQAKERATYNLPTKLLVELEEKWMKMRRISGSKKISKTLLVEEALKIAFEDFDLKEEGADFFLRIMAAKNRSQGRN